MMEPANAGSLDDLHAASAVVAELAEQLAAPEARTRPIASLPQILIRTSREIRSVLHSLYRSRTLLEQAAVPRLQRTKQKLEEVSQATETATHQMLDKLDRASLMIDELGEYLVSGVAPNHRDALRLHAELRDEVHHLVLGLQFQDIVSQQIGYATHVLQETEHRISQLASHFNNTVFGAEPDSLAGLDWTPPCDPDASTARPDERQAVADAVFARRPPSK